MSRLTALFAAPFFWAALSANGWAAAADYRFELVERNVAVSPDAPLTVRLLHLPTGKPVVDAVLLPARMEMPMDGMAPMSAKLSGGKPDGRGGYAFKADIGMTGLWTLKLAAKVQGESETVTGAIPVSATAAAGDAHKH